MVKFIEEFKTQSRFNQAFYVLALGFLAYYGFIHTGLVKLPAAKAYDCSEVSGSTVAIEIQDGKFEPSEVKAQVCDRLEFINKTSEEVWPAVGPHPTHTSYPGFDSLRPLPPGEKYDFTVNRLGTYTFHDHLHEARVGRVTISKRK